MSLVKTLHNKHKDICPIADKEEFYKEAKVLFDDDSFIIYRELFDKEVIELTLMVAKGRSIIRLVNDIKGIANGRPILFTTKDNRYIVNHSILLASNDDLKIYQLML